MFHPDGPTFWELARQALSSTTRGYDLLAPKFDVTPFRTPDGILKRSADYVYESSRPRRALDLCCGTGAMLEWLPPGSVGLDASRGMLRIARRKLQDHSVVRASALHPPFSAAFDLVTCFSALGHFFPSEHAQLVAAVKSCLRPGGHFLFPRKCTLKMFSPKDSLSFATTVNLLEAVPAHARTCYSGMMTAHGPSTEPSGPLEARAEAVDHALDVAFVRPDLEHNLFLPA